MIDRIAFGVVAAAMLLSALRVVLTKNLVHAVLWLGVTLAVTAVAYVILAAPFLAAVQLMLYTGGVLTLMLFGIMLTRHPASQGVVLPNEQSGRAKGLIVAVAMFGVMAGAVAKTGTLPATPAADVAVIDLGKSFLTDHLLAFEVLSVLLLAAMVGAIVLARRHDAGLEKEPVTRRAPARPAELQKAVEEVR